MVLRRPPGQRKPRMPKAFALQGLRHDGEIDGLRESAQSHEHSVSRNYGALSLPLLQDCRERPHQDPHGLQDLGRERFPKDDLLRHEPGKVRVLRQMPKHGPDEKLEASGRRRRESAQGRDPLPDRGEATVQHGVVKTLF